MSAWERGEGDGEFKRTLRARVEHPCDNYLSPCRIKPGEVYIEYRILHWRGTGAPSPRSLRLHEGCHA